MKWELLDCDIYAQNKCNGLQHIKNEQLIKSVGEDITQIN